MQVRRVVKHYEFRAVVALLDFIEFSRLVLCLADCSFSRDFH
jgi:hypothetical protein